MIENKQNPTLSFLMALFPAFRESIYQLYDHDPVFREIAADYKDCADQHEAIISKTGKQSEGFADTLRELKEELDSYLAKSTIRNHKTL